MKISSLLILIIILISCSSEKSTKQINNVSLPYYKEASFTPHWFDVNSDSLNNFHQIPNFSLYNQNGEKITQETVKDKIYITDFFFTTCPGICPKMTANMSILQDTFLTNIEVLLVSHSVTPHTDSIPILKAYAEKNGVIDTKWHLLTGKRSQIYNLGRKAYFVEENLGEEKSMNDFLHTENFVLIDKNRHIRGIYNGLNKTAIQQLIKDVRVLLKE